jgi:hypothetical protein
MAGMGSECLCGVAGLIGTGRDALLDDWLGWTLVSYHMIKRYELQDGSSGSMGTHEV